jgi:hypothetical protein
MHSIHAPKSNRIKSFLSDYQKGRPPVKVLRDVATSKNPTRRSLWIQARKAD